MNMQKPTPVITSGESPRPCSVTNAAHRSIRSRPVEVEPFDDGAREAADRPVVGQGCHGGDVERSGGHGEQIGPAIPP